MIYCVVPEALSDELYERLVAYYLDDDNVTVIVDRRQADRRSRLPAGAPERQQRAQRDRRRARVPGDFPPLDTTDS
jgi:hypothetical protein